MSVLVDTNVLSELRKGERAHHAVVAWAKATGWHRFYSSWVVLAEMRHGELLVRRHDRAQAAVLDAWIIQVQERLSDRILPVDHVVADIWARLMVPNPRPAMDTLIAATAVAHGLILVTRNLRDFVGTDIDLIDPWTFQS